MYLSLCLGLLLDPLETFRANSSTRWNFCSVPAEDHLVYLTEHVPGRNQYINAAFMPVSGTHVVRSTTAETSRIQCQLFGECLCVCSSWLFAIVVHWQQVLLPLCLFLSLSAYTKSFLCVFYAADFPRLQGPSGDTASPAWYTGGFLETCLRKWRHHNSLPWLT